MRLFWSPVFAVALIGCPEASEDKEETGVGHDTADTADTGDSGGDTGLPDFGPPGCINLEQTTGDFATITEAIDAAPEGTTVFVCAGEYNEQLTLKKAISVVGEGSATTTLTAPVDANGIEINAAASVSGFTVRAANHGVVVSGAEGASLADIYVEAPTGWGVRAEDALDLTISMCTFADAAAGGVDLERSSVTVDGSLFSRPIGYGVRALDGSYLVVSNNIFDQVSDTGNGTKHPTKSTDGWAVLGEDSEVYTSENTVTTGSYGGIKVSNGALTMAGDLFSDTPYAVVADEASFSADGLEIYGAVSQGIFATHSSVPMSLTNSTIALNGASEGHTSCSTDYSSFDGFCGGVYMETAAATLSNLSVSDYESFGLILVSALGTVDAPLSATDVTLTNNGRWSMRMDYVEGAIDGLTITGNRVADSENTEPCYPYVDQDDAALFVESTLAVTNSSVTDNNGWGLVFLFSDASVESSVVNNSECAGVANYQGKLLVTGNTLGKANQAGAVYDSAGAISVIDNTFVDTSADYTYSYDDGTGHIISYEYSGYGQDVFMYQSVEAYIADNTFSGGDSSIEAYYNGATIENNTWDNYNGTLILGYYNDPSDPVKVKHNTATNLAGTAVSANYGSVEVDDFVIEGTLPYTSSYTYYKDGIVTSSSTYSYGMAAFEAYGYYYGYFTDTDGDGVTEFVTYGDEGDLKLEDIQIDAAYGSVLEAQDSSVEISGMEVGSAGTYGIYAYWDHYAPSLQVDDVYIGTTGNDGVYAVANTSDEGVFVANGLTFDATTGQGIYAIGFGEVTLTGVTVSTSTEEGVFIGGDYSSYDYETSTSTSGVRETDSTLNEVTVASAGLDGIWITDGTAMVSASTATAGAGDGLSLADTEADVQNNAFTGNAAYGMSCSNATLSACAANDLTLNAAGTQNGCDDACGL